VKIPSCLFEIIHDHDLGNPHILYGLGLSNKKIRNKIDATIYYEKLINIWTPKELVEMA
jgi:hypothetical protein